MDLEAMERNVEVTEAPEIVSDVTVTNFEGIEQITAEVYDDLDGFEGQDVIVTGSPFEIVDILDYNQGDNSYGALGCCGLVSCSNFLNICGLDTSEEELVDIAVNNGLCMYDPYGSADQNGGTTPEIREIILEAYGVDVTTFEPYEPGGSIEDVANAVEDGCAAMISVNAGYLWDDSAAYGDGCSNHVITVTGTVRDTNGEVVGMTICDSGRGAQSDACRVLTVDELNDCYTNVPGATAIITDDAVR